MARLKGLRITRKEKGDYTVIPLFYANRGRTRAAPLLKVVGRTLSEVIAEVVANLVARGELKR